MIIGEPFFWVNVYPPEFACTISMAPTIGGLAPVDDPRLTEPAVPELKPPNWTTVADCELPKDGDVAAVLRMLVRQYA